MQPVHAMKQLRTDILPRVVMRLVPQLKNEAVNSHKNNRSKDCGKKKSDR